MWKWLKVLLPEAFLISASLATSKSLRRRRSRGGSGKDIASRRGNSFERQHFHPKTQFSELFLRCLQLDLSRYISNNKYIYYTLYIIYLSYVFSRKRKSHFTTPRPCMSCGAQWVFRRFGAFSSSFFLLFWFFLLHFLSLSTAPRLFTCHLSSAQSSGACDALGSSRKNPRPLKEDFKENS